MIKATRLLKSLHKIRYSSVSYNIHIYCTLFRNKLALIRQNICLRRLGPFCIHFTYSTITANLYEGGREWITPLVQYIAAVYVDAFIFVHPPGERLNSHSLNFTFLDGKNVSFLK